MRQQPRSRPLATPPISRRALLTGTAALGVGLAVPFVVRSAAQGRLPAPLFTLGVASGHPLPTGVVLWTRLAPDPLTDGGMPRDSVPVQWEVAADERFGNVVQK